ncbi:MAG TPA: hypothetical protein VFM25_07310, partial [Verrucomicrobiae bacterium]|nr:hypothetical protein [Verrucomicrobiae bacterium]
MKIPTSLMLADSATVSACLLTSIAISAPSIPAKLPNRIGTNQFVRYFNSPSGKHFYLASSNSVRKLAKQSYFVGERGPDSRTWYKIIAATNAAGQVTTHTNRAYVELATGMNYLDDITGKWKESREIIEPFPGGAIARQGRHKVIFANNLNTAGAIALQMPDGKRLRSNVLGLEYFDASTGKSVLIAEVKDSQGQIVGSNQVIYADAFTGISADVRYTYRLSGFEQDVILRAQPPSPKSYGLNPGTTSLRVLTEFLNPPEPKISTAHARSTVATDGIRPDEELDFGSMHMGRGEAFGAAGGVSPEHRKTRVHKQFLTMDGRKILVEEVPIGTIQKDLKNLPPIAS